jgi:hypothetical protein
MGRTPSNQTLEILQGCLSEDRERYPTVDVQHSMSQYWRYIACSLPFRENMFEAQGIAVSWLGFGIVL